MVHPWRESKRLHRRGGCGTIVQVAQVVDKMGPALRKSTRLWIRYARAASVDKAFRFKKVLCHAVIDRKRLGPDKDDCPAGFRSERTVGSEAVAG